MMPGKFNRAALPKVSDYFAALSQRVKWKSEWARVTCPVCGAVDALLIKTSGAHRCTHCDAHGRDLLDLHQAVTGLSFTAAARALGAWGVAS